MPGSKPYISRLGWVLGGALLVLASAGAYQAVSQEAAPAALPATRPSPITIERVDRPEMPLRGVLARVDLTDPRVKVRAVPGGDEALVMEGPWPTRLQTVRHVAEREKLAVAVNGDFFAAEKTVDAEGNAATRQYVVGKKANAIGVAMTDGVLWSKSKAVTPMLVVKEGGEVGFASGKTAPEGAKQVMSGHPMLVEKGKVVLEVRESDSLAPRTAVGLTKDRKTLMLLVVDGRSLRSRGLKGGELANLMKELGAEDAMNLDGGGSTTMVQEVEGKMKVLNVPSDGAERPVANVLGVSVDP